MATQVTVNAGQGSTQVTVITGEGSTSYKVEAGSRGPAGTNGTNGTNGAAGPNSVTTSTSSNLTGFIAADGTNVSGATAGATAATANTLALRDATGGSNFAAVGASSVTSSGAISTTGSFGSISTIGGSAGISTEGNGATITTSGSSAYIQTTGGEAFIATSGVYAQIYTSGDYASITTTGDYASITTSGANAFIQSRSTFKLYNGASTTTLSHSPTADRAIAFPNKAGTLAMVDAETHTGAHAFSSTTRPTSAGTGTPEATSLITRADGDARFSQVVGASLTAGVDSDVNTTTYKTVTELSFALEIGRYYIDAVLVHNGNASYATAGIKDRLNFSGTATASGSMYRVSDNATTSTSVPNSRSSTNPLIESALTNRSQTTWRKGVLTVTAAGTLSVQIAQSAAVAAANTTLATGSSLIITRLI